MSGTARFNVTTIWAHEARAASKALHRVHELQMDESVGEGELTTALIDAIRLSKAALWRVHEADHISVIELTEADIKRLNAANERAKKGGK